MNKTRISSIPAACVAALLVGGCASLPGGETGSPDRPAGPEPAALAMTEEISFSVSGEPMKNGGKCFLRMEIGYPENVQARSLQVDLEFDMRQDDGWLGVSWYEGILVSVPSTDLVGKPFRGEPHRPDVMHYFLMEELLLDCQALRARVVVNSCEPGPCPALLVDDRDNLFPLELVDKSPR